MKSDKVGSCDLRTTNRRPQFAPADGGDFAEGINDAGQISGRYCAITGCNGYYFDGTTYSALAVGPGNTEAFIILLTWRKHG